MYLLHRSYRAILTIIGVLACHAQFTLASDQNSEFGYMTLNGLHSLAVEVDGIHRDFTRFGLDADKILQTTTNVLLENGIDVVDLDRAKTNVESALMRIKLNANKNQYGFYFYGISIELKHKLALNNAAGGFISTTIWHQGQTGIVMPTELHKLNDLISGLLAEFISDYRAQNPARVSVAR